MSKDLFESRMTVAPEWIDHNGHMNVTYFVLAFDAATDAAYEAWGLGLDYPRESGCSVFTLGMNVDYLGELFEGDALTITTQLIDCDAKRVHYFHRMQRDSDGMRAATNECLAINVDLDSRRACPFPRTIHERLQSIRDRHAAHGLPDRFGRKLGIR